MTTFLGLCSLMATRSGIIGAAPSAVTGQTGRQAKCVDWVMNAWQLIQELQDWNFLYGEVSAVALTIGTASYTGSALGVASRFGRFLGDRPGPSGRYKPWTIYDNSIGTSDETALCLIPYMLWREMYDRGAQTNQRPVHYAIAPDQSIRFGPIPEKAYKVRGEYVKAPQVLAANGDIPDMPTKFHDIIVWRAIMLAAEHDESPPGLAAAVTKFQQMLTDMMSELLPDLDENAAGPLA
jgi:hypothetical protein